MLHQDFVPCSDHQVLQFINSQKTINQMHAPWIEFLQQFSFVLKHKVGSQNRAADTLSRRSNLFTTLHSNIVGFKALKDCYSQDKDFSVIGKNANCTQWRISICWTDIYLKGRDSLYSRRSIQNSSDRWNQWWSWMWPNVTKFVQQCAVCQSYKGT